MLSMPMRMLSMPMVRCHKGYKDADLDRHLSKSMLTLT